MQIQATVIQNNKPCKKEQHLLLLCSKINVNFRWCQSRRLHKVQVHITVNTDTCIKSSKSEDSMSNMPGIHLSINWRSKKYGILGGCYRQHTQQVSWQGTGRVFQNYSCFLLRSRSIVSFSSCGKWPVLLSPACSSHPPCFHKVQLGCSHRPCTCEPINTWRLCRGQQMGMHARVKHESILPHFLTCRDHGAMLEHSCRSALQ